MEKISELLKNSARSEPGKLYDVIITLHEGSDVKKLTLNTYNILMDNIISASVTGSELLQLSDQEIVKSIELDEEMGVL